MPPTNNTLKWRFDVNTFRLLGQDLITDRITALFELVKNSYDANAQNVTIQFLNIGYKGEDSKIIIKDDGIGMTLDDIENKWMVIGTKSKRTSIFSPEPYKRRYIGEKGIGRFAVDKLGAYVRIRTKAKDQEKELVVTIDWLTYEKLADGEQTKLNFTDVENEYKYVDATFEHGTTLELLQPREVWTLDDIERAYKELSRLVSPFSESKYPFKIHIHAPEYEPYAKSKFVESKEKEFSSHSFQLNFDEGTNKQEYLFFDKEKQELLTLEREKPSFGFIKFYCYYFDEQAKNKFNTHHKKTSVNIDGVKIYRDGILTTPFAEYEAKDEKRRDILGINKRRWRATFDRIGSRDVIGFIEITRDDNPKIKDATNRQDFQGTQEYSDLKGFIYDQLDEFMKSLKVQRREKKKENLGVFKESEQVLKNIQKEFKKLQKDSKDDGKKQEVVANIAEQVVVLQQGFSAINEEYKESQKTEKRKEKMYFSLMSLSLFAANVSHAVREVIKNIKDEAQFIYEEPLTTENENLFKEYAHRIHREIQRLLKVVDFMLKYAKTDLPEEFFNVKELIQSTFDAHETIFIQRNIKVELDIEPNLSLLGNTIFFQDIITNLISNSIKSTEGNFERKIRCTAKANNKEIHIMFSDNGIGIPEKNRHKVFDMYFTTTAEQGGAGIGLYAVRMNVEALDGSVEVVDNELQPTGVTIRLTIPFEK